MKNKTHSIDVSSVAPILTLIVFSVCVLFVLLFGTKIYKNTLQRDRAQFEARTIAQYVATRIHQNDGDGQLFIGNFDDCIPSLEGDTLFCVETVNGTEYYTRIYCHEGSLYELYSAAESQLNRIDGERILPLADISFRQINGAITVTLTSAENKTTEETVFLRSYDGN